MCRRASRRELDVRDEEVQPCEFGLGRVCRIGAAWKVGDGRREEQFRLDAADDGGVADADYGTAGAVGEGGGCAVGRAEGGESAAGRARWWCGGG